MLASQRAQVNTSASHAWRRPSVAMKRSSAGLRHEWCRVYQSVFKSLLLTPWVSAPMGPLLVTQDNHTGRDRKVRDAKSFTLLVTIRGTEKKGLRSRSGSLVVGSRSSF